MKWLGAMAVVLALAGILRFHDLGHAAVRSDEIAFLFRTQQNQSLVELWKSPPWFNQIPLADSVPVVWERLTRQTVDEGVVRQPFALLGWLTVAYCTAWMLRRKGLGAGLLLGLWMAVLPYHVYHSREAYYYVLVMLFCSGMVLRGADFAAQLRRGTALKGRAYAEWAAWALLACLSHMSVWVVAAATGLWLGLAGVSGLKGPGRKRHVQALGLVVLALSAGMVRWVLRALHEMQRAAADPSAHIGSAFNWVGPRVLPFFAGGANLVGCGLLAAAFVAAVVILVRARGRPARTDALYATLMGISFSSLVCTYAYITVVGGGEKAKLAYFAANLPGFLVWMAMSMDKVWENAPALRRLALGAAAGIVLAGLLALPAWQVTQLDGKPAAYRQIRAWLDTHLEPGDVAIVDRWLEPWNEMALYAPSNVTVTFTVPDEPYDNYVGGNWRKVTRDLYERNGAQAFIRLQRNHEKRIGLWTWPETWFHRRAVVTNAAGLWLRDRGFAPMEEYYTESNRVQTEIFYDTHADIAARAQAAGQAAVWFFGPGWRVFKPWQQGDFADYHVLEGGAEMSVWNLRDQPLTGQGTITAAALGGSQTVRIGEQAPLVFPPDQLTRQNFTLQLLPGITRLPWKRLGAPGGAVLVRDFQLQAVP